MPVPPARYGQERHAELARWQPAPHVREDLRTLTRLRTQLVRQRVALTNQLQAPGGAIAKHRLQAMRDAATAHIAAIEADMRALVETDPDTAEAVALIEKNPWLRTPHRRHRHRPDAGTGHPQPAPGRLPRRPRAAPPPERSARRLPPGPRRTPRGQSALFMAAMAARTHNPTLSAVYNRLLANGKKPIVALTALMRKLITIINARIRDARKTPQTPSPQLS